METSNLAMTEQAKGAVRVTFVVADAIKELGQVNAGKLYAHLASKIDINAFEAILDILRKARVIETRNHVIYWTGPKSEGEVQS